MENSLSDTIWAIDQGKVKECLRLALKSWSQLSVFTDSCGPDFPGRISGRT